MNRTLLILTNLLLVLFIVSSLPVNAQKAVCVYCDVELPNGIHKPGCPYYKKPGTTTSKPNSSNKGNNSRSASGSLYILDAINSFLDGMLSETETDKSNEKMIAAEKKRISDSLNEVNHNNMMKSFKKLDDTKPSGLKSIDEYSPGKFNKINFNCKITSYKGTIEIRRNGKLIADSKNLEAVDLQVGDVIKTGTTGIIKLHFSFEDEGKDLILGRYTEVKIFKDESGTIFPLLQKGRSFSSVTEVVLDEVRRTAIHYLNPYKRKFYVRTPNAAGAVRGTIFTIDQDDTTGSEFNVFDGSILVAPISGTDSVLVNKGEKVVVNPQGKISNLLPADLKKLELWREEISQIESEENTIK